MEETDISDGEHIKALVEKTPTITLPFLETKDGNISESKAISYYLCAKYKKELLGETEFERAKVNQWIEFACNEINKCNEAIIYPIFGWKDFCKENFNKFTSKVKEYLKILDKELSKNEYITGKNLTLADVILFGFLRPLMMLHLPDKMRKNLCPNTEKWFAKIMKTPEAIDSYGKTELCKTPMKAFDGKINRNKLMDDKKEKKEKEAIETKEKNEKNKTKEDENKKENNENVGNDTKKSKKERKKEKKQQKENENKDNKQPKQTKEDKAKKKNKVLTDKGHGTELVKEIKKEEEYVPSMLELPRFNIKKKENNPLDSLPPSKFDLDKFKKDFLDNSNKKNAMKHFWKDYDPEGYSLWHIEYKNEPGEFVSFFRTVIVKGDILLQLEYFKKYCFGVLGVYGSDGDYTISGCLMWRGQEIPDEIKEINCFDKLTLKKLDPKDKKEQQLVHDYWTKIKENEKVFKRSAIDTRYFH